jgi:hypothetical protein
MNDPLPTPLSFRTLFKLLAACVGLSVAGCAGGDEVSVRGRTVPVEAVQGNEAECAGEAWHGACGERGGIGSMCDGGGTPLCCFETGAADALCVDDEDALETTSSPLVVGGIQGGGSWEFSTCQIPSSLCFWVCDPPEHDDDIYHCRLVCGCG